MIVDTDVMRIGRNRMRPDSSTAAMVSSPFALSWLAYSTSRIEFLVTRPMSSTMPISLYRLIVPPGRCSTAAPSRVASAPVTASGTASSTVNGCRSEEHTSELQSPCNLVCRLLLEKKKIQTTPLEHDRRQ